MSGSEVPPRVQVSWVDHDEDDGDLFETGWIMAVEGDVAVINCDCGPRTVRRPLTVLHLGSAPTAVGAAGARIERHLPGFTAELERRAPADRAAWLLGELASALDLLDVEDRRNVVLTSEAWLAGRDDNPQLYAPVPPTTP